MRSLAEQLLACVALGKAVTETLDRERILDVILARLSTLVAARNWTVYVVDEPAQVLRFELVVGLDPEAVRGRTVKIGEGIAGSVARSGEAILLPDAARDPRVDRSIDRATGFVTSSIITLPLKHGGRVTGVLQLVNPDDRTLFEPDRRSVLTLIADFVAIALANARSYERVKTLSLTDDVTGFFNARYLHQRLGELIDSGTETALVFLDMDHFKRIVDTYGHPLGAKVLRDVARVIGSQLDAEDALVRYGGDEYVILLPRQGKEEAHAKVERIRSVLVATSFLREEGHDVHVTASFGIAHHPEDAADVKELLRSADGCLYRSKGQGKNRITVAPRKSV